MSACIHLFYLLQKVFLIQMELYFFLLILYILNYLTHSIVYYIYYKNEQKDQHQYILPVPSSLNYVKIGSFLNKNFIFNIVCNHFVLVFSSTTKTCLFDIFAQVLSFVCFLCIFQTQCFFLLLNSMQIYEELYTLI